MKLYNNLLSIHEDKYIISINIIQMTKTIKEE